MTRSAQIRRTGLPALAVAVAAIVAIALYASAADASSTQVLRLSARAHMILRFTTSHLRAHTGRIMIIMHNPSNSGMSHGISVEGHGVDRDGPIVRPGHNSQLTVTLRRTGTYEYYCPVPGHKQAGMKGTLTVS